MRIFQAEIQDGLESVLSSKGTTHVVASVRTADTEPEAVEKSLRSEANRIEELIGRNARDLAYIESILVSAGWNLNDDVFVAEELWAAKDSPVHKPINIEHDGNRIVGHMVSSTPLDKSGNVIDEPQDEFDIGVAGVLYKDVPGIEDVVSDVIEKANNGEAFVSMEVWFDDFDFAVRDTVSGAFKLVPRTKASAFLTKHLRVYGGTGTFEGVQVGRVLRKLEFAGKGIVTNPANPDSVIKEALAMRAAAQTNPKGGANSMAQDNPKPSVEDLQSKLSETQKSLETKTSEHDAVLAALNELKSKELDKQVETLNVSLAEKDEEIKTLSEAKAEAEKQLKEVTARAEKAESQLAGIRKVEKARERMAELAKVKKIDDEEATLAELKDMTDETFAMVLKYAGETSQATEPSQQDNTEEDARAKAAQASLDAAEEIPEPDLQAGTENERETLANQARATAHALLRRKPSENE